ncbi:proline-serine-threonine phosphatase-interacting protein 1-like isoform X2 [Macrobrachium rosenbergii]|uniref:proline-serine-threonine phosphatase-interacting protein 1-like isoform X2 n=1 Tax=Macrobrachium rosenbergii TaxID=79674 RepID=UPI0034D76852
MGSIGNFADDFWNTEIGDFAGWNIVHQRIKDGGKVTQNYIELLKQVTAAMETFGRSLLKTAKSSSLPEMEHGKLKSALQTARVSVEAWGLDTLDAAAALSGQINSLSQHLTQAKGMRKREDEDLRNQQQQLSDAMRKVKQAQRTAQTKLKEKMECESHRFVLESKYDPKQKELEKATQAEKRAEDAVLDAEFHHREVVAKHNEALEGWKMVTRSSMNIMQHQENVRTALLSVDVGQELNSWVALHSTKQRPPSPLAYQPVQRPSQLSTPISTPANSARSTVTEFDGSSTSRSRSGTATPEPLHDATVLYHFGARSDSEVSLKAGETVSVLDDSNEEWVYVRNRKGATGFVPATYIKVLPQQDTVSTLKVPCIE